MPNYSLVIDSTFQPFSFERYIQPYQIYGQEYKAQEEALSELSTKANVWKELANEQTDPYAYRMYKSYADDLESQAGQLAREGLSPSSRQNVLNMRQRYSRDIIPIEQAYTRRQELIDEQRKLQAQDNTLMFNRNASTISLDDLIRNPELSYQSYSGETLRKQASVAAKNLAKNMRENPREWRSILGGQYYETLMRNGLTPEEVSLVLQGADNASPELRKILDDVVQSSGIETWGDRALTQKAYEYAGQGLWDAIGETQYQTLQNKNWQPTPAPESPPGGITDPSNLRLPRVIEGVDSLKQKDSKLGLLEGLRELPGGEYSSFKLDEARRKVEDYEKRIKEKLTPEEISALEDFFVEKPSIRGITPSSISQYATPKGYELFKKYLEAKQPIEAIETLEEKYSHLGNTPYERMYIGSKLEKLQQGQERSFFSLNIEDTDYKKVQKGIKHVLTDNLTEEVIKSNSPTSAGIYTADGKKLNVKQTKEFNDNIDNASIRISAGNNPRLEVVLDHKKYLIQGIEQIDDFNRDLNTFNNYLKDFSKESIEPYITAISDQTYEGIMSNNPSNVRISESLNIKPIPGTNYNGTVLWNPTTGDYVKVIIDQGNNILAINSLGDELSGGTNRDYVIMDMANKGLLGLQDLVATNQ